jgi:hypothetical protein
MRRFRAIIFSITLFASTALGLLGPAAASAQSIQNAVDPQSTAAPAGYQMQIPIPVSPLEQGVSNAGVGVVSDVSQYIGRIYYFAIGIVGLVAAVMMIIGGFQYLTSAGDTAKIGAAKKRITDAIIGLVLMLGSYALLNTINPALLAFRPLSALIAENEIKTQLNFIPFCEDLRDPNDPKLPQPVEALADSADCGTLGTYTLEKGVSYCIMRGDCGERQIKTVGIKDPYWGTGQPRSDRERDRHEDAALGHGQEQQGRGMSPVLRYHHERGQGNGLLWHGFSLRCLGHDPQQSVHQRIYARQRLYEFREGPA